MVFVAVAAIQNLKKILKNIRRILVKMVLSSLERNNTRVNVSSGSGNYKIERLQD